MTPTEALAAWEAADARKRAAQVEQEQADAAWVRAACTLAEVIENAQPALPRGPVMIGGKVVETVWDGDSYTVLVQTPPVLG